MAHQLMERQGKEIEEFQEDVQRRLKNYELKERKIDMRLYLGCRRNRRWLLTHRRNG